jgi:pre-mRNA processing factor 4 (PRP4) like
MCSEGSCAKLTRGCIQENDVQQSEKDTKGVAQANTQHDPAPARQESVLPDTEVRWRLRRLGQPVTLFGEDEKARHQRFKHVERTLEVQDEEAGGGERANVLLTIAKEDRLKARAATEQSQSQVGPDVATPPKSSGNGAAAAEVCRPLARPASLFTMPRAAKGVNLHRKCRRAQKMH